MGEVKQINIKNRTYHFYNDMTNLKKFQPNLLKIDKKHYKGNNIYCIGYITIKKIDDYESIYSINPLHLKVNHASGHIEEKNGNKYLIFDSVDDNKELQEKYKYIWNGIKNKMQAINRSECDYEKDFLKLNSYDDDLPLKKPLKFHMMTIVIRSVFEEDGKFYPEVFLDDTLYEV